MIINVTIFCYEHLTLLSQFLSRSLDSSASLSVNPSSLQFFNGRWWVDLTERQLEIAVQGSTVAGGWSHPFGRYDNLIHPECYPLFGNVAKASPSSASGHAFSVPVPLSLVALSSGWWARPMSSPATEGALPSKAISSPTGNVEKVKDRGKDKSPLRIFPESASQFSYASCPRWIPYE